MALILRQVAFAYAANRVQARRCNYVPPPDHFSPYLKLFYPLCHPVKEKELTLLAKENSILTALSYGAHCPQLPTLSCVRSSINDNGKRSLA